MNLTTNIEGFFNAQFNERMTQKERACKTPIVSELIGAWDVSINGLSLVRNVTILLARTIDGLFLRGGVGSLLLQVPAKIAQFGMNVVIKKTQLTPTPSFHVCKNNRYKFADNWNKGRLKKLAAIARSLTPVKDDCYNIGLGLFRLIPGTELYYKAKYDSHIYRDTTHRANTLRSIYQQTGNAVPQTHHHYDTKGKGLYRFNPIGSSVVTV